MDVEEFRNRGKEMVDYICDYMSNINTRRVASNVDPGYLKDLIPTEAPEDPEDWNTIMADVDRKIMPGITHWQHPRFHAYFPSGNSYPSILADMLSDAIGCIGFSWAASPACTELETITMNWLGKAIGLPDDFLHTGRGCKGGGVIQGSASECILVCMLAARNQAIQNLKETHPHVEDESDFLPKLVAYCSTESHSCVEKAAMILLVKLRILDTGADCSLSGETLRKAMEADEKNGLYPFFVSTTFGSTACGSFDNILDIGPVCKEKPSVWLHVDGAYAGNSFICPELRPLMAGIEYADSFNTNPNKWLTVSFDCSCLWVRNKIRLTQALVVDPLYLQHANSEETIDYRHWGIPLSRRFRSLKLWFVIRKYGIKGLQAYIRNHIRLAKYFESLMLKDSRFEVMNNVRLGLVCFRMKGPDSLNQILLATLNATGKLHMIPSTVKNKYVIRFCVTAQHAKDADIDYAFNVISEYATMVLESGKPKTPEAVRPQLTRQTSRRFSFTRSISKEIFEKRASKTNLHDGATPILVVDDESESPTNESIVDELVNMKNHNNHLDGECLLKDLQKFTIDELKKIETNMI